MEENELISVDNNNAVEYTDDNIRHLSDMEHVRTRPGMYIGRLGDGAHAEDGIYVLLKEVIDNSIDEFKMQAGKKIEITVEENLRVSVRDYGRGIPQGKLVEAVSKLSKHPKKEIAAKVGEQIAKVAQEAGVQAVVFDRNGYLYHGRIKELADAARNGGLKF